MFNPYFERFVEPARRRPQIWRLVLGSVAALMIYMAGLAVLFGLVFLAVGRDAFPLWTGRIVHGTTPAGMLLLMAAFIGMAPAPVIVARWLHKRGPGTLFGPRVRVLRDFVTTAGIVLAIYAILLLFWSLEFDAEPNLPPGLWLSLLPLAILGLLVQTLAEELVFRAYLMQQLAARFRSPLIWMILPCLAFGAVHYDPGSAGDNAWIVVAAAATFGLVAADLTRVTGSIGAAWGYHFANNSVAILFIATKGTLPGLALYLTPYAIDDATLVPVISLGDVVVMVGIWLVLRRVLRR